MRRFILVIMFLTTILMAQEKDSSAAIPKFYFGISTPMFYAFGPEVQYRFDEHWEIGGEFFYFFNDPDGTSHKEYKGYVVRGSVLYDFLSNPKKFAPFGIVGFAYRKEDCSNTITYGLPAGYGGSPPERDTTYIEEKSDDERYITLGVGSRLKLSSHFFLDGEIAGAIHEGFDFDPWFRLGVECGF